MQQLCAGKQRIWHIGFAEGFVRARVVQKHAVHTGRRNHHAVGGRTCLVHLEAHIRTLRRKQLANQPAERVRTDAGNQPRGYAQPV